MTLSTLLRDARGACLPMNCYRCKSDPCRCGHTIYHGNVMDVLPGIAR